MSEKVVKINRLYNNNATVRSIDVEQAMRENKNLVIELKGTNKMMTIPCDEIAHSYTKVGKKKYRSIYNSSQEYVLVDFPWNPDAAQKELL